MNGDVGLAKEKMSPAAIIMHTVIYTMVAITIGCFVLYYGGFCPNEWIKWVGIVAFMVTYHFWLRIIMGDIMAKVKVDYRAPFFQQRKFEKKFYEILRVKSWKNKVMTYNPELFSLKEHSLDEIAKTMAKAERDHWINEGISLFALLFAFVWGAFPVFLLSSVFAMCFDGRFIAIQRYNRPRIIKIIDKKARLKNK